ncbi:MAG: hypothetical protein QOF11_397 [Chloroflexota bacterium]|nr:hypothetical protein [Chloroflexota bacterium]
MTATTSAGATDRYRTMLGELGKSWMLFFVFGVLSILLGLAAIFLTGATIVTVAIFFAAQLFVSGVFGLIRAFSDDLDTGGRVLTAIIGILGVIVGFALLREPFQSIVVMAFVIGIYWVAHGIMEIFGAFSVQQGRVWGIVLGIISVLAGGVILLYPISSLVILSVVVGTWLVILGVIEVVGAWRLRNVSRRIGA